MTDDRLQLLLDRSEIERVVYDYATGLDTKDWALWRSIFTDELQVKFRPAVEAAFTGLGQAWVSMTADEWVEGRRDLFTGLATTQHQMTNPRITIDGDTATCIMYMQAIHFMPGKPDIEYTLGGYYVDDLVRTPEGWKLTRVNLNVTWERGDATMLERGRALGQELVAAGS
ncbi:nuclear transport factor 2 family protein [Salinibacterium sp. ZJ450]|uniref:nuclear transport factor 2 family protein n=1 Tax=Salinibacterium sp. ZJ450 TaxID=2708338 RepID=UPI0014210C8D|nr:nuclear transport factor 2 family protein [Salinibacterium sp. ZJ450]